MGRFIPVDVETVSDRGKIQNTVYQFAPLTIKTLRDFKEIINQIQKKEKEDQKKEEEDPDFVPDQFDDIEPVLDFMLDLAKVKHKDMTKDQFEDTFSVSDIRKVMLSLMGDSEYAKSLGD